MDTYKNSELHIVTIYHHEHEDSFTTTVLATPEETNQIIEKARNGELEYDYVNDEEIRTIDKIEVMNQVNGKYFVHRILRFDWETLIRLQKEYADAGFVNS